MTEQDQLLSRIQSAAKDVLDKSRPYFTRFLTEAEQMKISAMKFSSDLVTGFYGGKGNEDAVRRCFGIVPSFYVNDEGDFPALFPIKAITFSFRRCDEVTHREVLGTLMGLGLERDTIGDICITEGKAAVFVTEKPAELIMDSVLKIGRVGVSCAYGVDFELPKQQYEELSYSVASLRLDNLVRNMANCSRGTACDRYLKPQLVQLNGEVCDNPSKAIKEGDIITIRGKGKFLLSEIGAAGRKGNTHIKVKKYK
ncbi:MAG: hypothetical protein J6D27_04825 [Ruminiclostridium sp.]|nr:hypothetical protein [Ruminiclostridium sp.]